MDYTMLWTTEHELAFDDDILMIPRVKPERSLNERYCAGRRNITKEVTLKNSDVEIDHYKGQLKLEGVDISLSRRLLRANASEQSVLDIHLSIALCHSDSSLFLCYGTRRSDNQKAYVLSQKNRPVVLCTSENSLLIESPLPEGMEGQALDAVASHLIARSLLSTLPRSGAILIYEPPSDSFVAAIESSSQWAGVLRHYKLIYLNSLIVDHTQSPQPYRC
jgi:hypothetical protein